MKIEIYTCVTYTMHLFRISLNFVNNEFFFKNFSPRLWNKTLFPKKRRNDSQITRDRSPPELPNFSKLKTKS